MDKNWQENGGGKNTKSETYPMQTLISKDDLGSIIWQLGIVLLQN